jgi:hypothetical protein
MQHRDMLVPVLIMAMPVIAVPVSDVLGSGRRGALDARSAVERNSGHRSFAA